MSKLTTLPLISTYVIGKAYPIIFLQDQVPFGHGYGDYLGDAWHLPHYSRGDGGNYYAAFRYARSKELRDE